MKKDSDGGPIEIKLVEKGRISIRLLGTSSLLQNRQSEKAQRQLLLPATKNRGERATTLKHQPLDEFRDSAYRYRVDTMPTRCYMPSTAFKKALMTAALDLPGAATKAGVGRHVSVMGETVPIWGVPRLRADMVRQAGIQRTPDVRFRTELPMWATEITIQFARLGLTETSVVNLVAAAGVICGVGDFRQEKGASDHGQWVIAGEGSPEADQWHEIVESGGREAQDVAFLNPDMNDDTLELLQWFDAEIQRRGRQREIDSQAAGKRKRSKDAPAGPGNGATADMEVQQNG
jgi:hypothetical protein